VHDSCKHVYAALPLSGQSAAFITMAMVPLSMQAKHQKVLPEGLKIQTVERASLGGFRKADKTFGSDKEKSTNLIDSVVDQAGDTKTGAPGTNGKIPPKSNPLVDQLGFNLFVAATTLFNAFIIGLEQEMTVGSEGVGDRLMWYMLELIIAGIFFIEIVLRIFCLHFMFICDIWNVCDTFVVAGCIIDALVLQPAGVGGKVRLLSTMRVMRIIRLVRLVRMFKFFRELWLLVGGLVNSIKALAWICIILLLLIYVCSVVVTTEIGQNDLVYGNGPSYDGEVWPYKEYFGTVFKSMFTLFQVMTLDGWCDDIVRHILYFQPMFAVLFIGFIILTAFVLMNVVIGIIVENTLAAATVADQAVDKEQSAIRRKALDQLAVMLELSDSNRSGDISKEELEAAAQSRVVQQQLEALDVKLSEVVQLFELLDYERRGSVDLKKFIISCRELVGGARRRDIAQVEITVGTLTQRLDSLNSKFKHIEREIEDLGNITEDFLLNTVFVLTGFDGSELDNQPKWQH